MYSLVHIYMCIFINIHKYTFYICIHILYTCSHLHTNAHIEKSSDCFIDFENIKIGAQHNHADNQTFPFFLTPPPHIKARTHTCTLSARRLLKVSLVFRAQRAAVTLP